MTPMLGTLKAVVIPVVLVQFRDLKQDAGFINRG